MRGGRVVRMVASYAQGPAEPGGVAAADSRYRVVLSPPLGRSYAARIAARYGIGREQLDALLRQRKVLDERPGL